jgi:hypothetical protein
MQVMISPIPMQRGESRGYGTKILHARTDSSVVSALMIHDWLSTLIFSVFSPDVSLAGNKLKYPNAANVNEPIVADLKLLWRRRIVWRRDHVAKFAIRVVRALDHAEIVRGEILVVIPESLLRALK